MAVAAAKNQRVISKSSEKPMEKTGFHLKQSYFVCFFGMVLGEEILKEIAFKKSRVCLPGQNFQI